MTISFVIPALNNKQLLIHNLPSVVRALENYNGKKELVISDDNSEDGTMEYLQAEKKSIESHNISCKFVTSQYPKGFSSNVNNAVSYVSGDVFILLNTDVVPEVGFLAPLLSHFSDNEVFAVGCLEKTKDDRGNNKEYGRSEGFFSKGFVMHKALPPLNGTSTFWVSCGSGAFRKSAWEKLGGLDQLYNPFYWEDIDLSYRAVKSGYKIVFEKKSVVHHFHEEGAIKSHFSQKDINKTAYRNQFIFMWKNITDKNLLFQHICWLPFHVVQSITSDRLLITGMSLAILSFTKIIVQRRNVEKLFKNTDQEVLNT